MKKFNIIMNLIGFLIVIICWILCFRALTSNPAQCRLYLLPIIYIIPWMIAGNRNTKNQAQVRIISLLLWWTFVGRVVALAMACTNNVYPEELDRSINVRILKNMKWKTVHVEWHKINIPLKVKIGQKFVVRGAWNESKKTWEKWDLYFVITEIE